MSSKEEKIANAILTVCSSKFSPEEARWVATLFTPENLRIWINMCKLSNETKSEESFKVPTVSTSDGESPSSSPIASMASSPESDSVLKVTEKFENLMRSPSPPSSEIKSSSSLSSVSSPSKSSELMVNHDRRNSLSTSSDGSNGLSNSSTPESQPSSTAQLVTQPRSIFPYARSRPGTKPKPSNRITHSIKPRGYHPNVKYCKMCKQNGEPWENYMSHTLKDENGFITCPVLFRYICELCGATGIHAHTRSFCPVASNLRRILSPGHPAYSRLMNFKYSNPSGHHIPRNYAK